ncbi:MAG: MFS transporter [Actinobacteria bacterium]|nr:MFS transporter [Actinomycetota bacterium]
MATSPDAQDDQERRRRSRALAAICVPLIMVSIDGTVLNVALPSIADALETTSSQLVWINSGYIIMFGSTILLSGGLGDKYGRKRFLIAGMAIFIIASVLAGLASTPNQLIVARLIQGVGGGIVAPCTLSLITNIFVEPAARAKAIGVWAGMSGVGVALGPILGGLLLTWFFWGSVFFINLPIVALGLVLIGLWVPDSKNPNAPPIDWVGAVLSIAGLFSFFYFLIEGSEQGFTSPPLLIALLVAVVLLGSFAVYELRTSDPMLDVALFKKPPFSSGVISIAVAFFALMGLVYELTLYLQEVKGFSPLKAGFALVPFAVVLMVGAPRAPRLVLQKGARRIVVLGLILTAIGMGVFVFVRVESTYLIVLAGLVLVAGGGSLVQPPSSNAIMGAVPREKAGMGSATNAAMRQIAASLGIAIIGGVAQVVYADRLDSSGALAGLSSSAIKTAKESITGAVGQGVPALTTAANEAFVDGMRVSMIIATAVALVGAFIASRFIPATEVDVSHHETDISV